MTVYDRPMVAGTIVAGFLFIDLLSGEIFEQLFPAPDEDLPKKARVGSTTRAVEVFG
jgi:hypothetical protein